MTEVRNREVCPNPLLESSRIEEPYIAYSLSQLPIYMGPIKWRLLLGQRSELVKRRYISGNRVEIYL